MAATRNVAGRGVARAARRGPARTTCEGAGALILDGRQDTTSRPHGAVLDLSGPDLRIAVVDADKRDILTFGPFPEEDVIAIWRSLGRAAALVPMIKSHDEPEALARALGCLRIGEAVARRNRPIAGRTRPRFLARRTAGRPAASPPIHRETEIAAGRDAR